MQQGNMNNQFNPGQPMQHDSMLSQGSQIRHVHHQQVMNAQRAPMSRMQVIQGGPQGHMQYVAQPNMQMQGQVITSVQGGDQINSYQMISHSQPGGMTMQQVPIQTPQGMMEGSYVVQQCPPGSIRISTANSIPMSQNAQPPLMMAMSANNGMRVMNPQQGNVQMPAQMRHQGPPGTGGSYTIQQNRPQIIHQQQSAQQQQMAYQQQHQQQQQQQQQNKMMQQMQPQPGQVTQQQPMLRKVNTMPAAVSRMPAMNQQQQQQQHSVQSQMAMQQQPPPQMIPQNQTIRPGGPSIPQQPVMYNQAPGGPGQIPPPQQQMQQQPTPQMQQQQPNQQRPKMQNPEADLILADLRRFASIYLESTKLALERIQQHPEGKLVIKKYNKLIEILEKPEANLNQLRSDQISRVESILREVKENPLHLLELEHNNKSNKAMAAQGQQRPRLPGPHHQGMVAQQQQQHHQMNQQGSQFKALVYDPRINYANSAFPAKNLNSLLAQPVPGGGPISPASAHHRMPMGYAGPGPMPPGQMLLPGQGPGPVVASPVGMPPRMAVGHPGHRMQGQNIPGAPHQPMHPQQQQQQQIQHQIQQQPSINKIIQVLSEDVKKMAESEKSDPVYANRLARIVDEISAETKSFRLATGYLLPSDLIANSPTLQQYANKRARKHALTEVKQDSSDSMDAVPLKKPDLQDDVKPDLGLEGLKKRDQENAPMSEELFTSKQEELACKDSSVARKDFAEDVLMYLNPRVQKEIFDASVGTDYGVVIVSEPHPPSMTEMENLDTCLNVLEWNNSCHIRFQYMGSKTASQPEEDDLNSIAPSLHVRIPPNYLKTRQLVWYMDPRETQPADSLSFSDEEDGGLDSEFQRMADKKRFMVIANLQTQIERKLSIVKRFYSGKMTVNLLAKAWFDAIRDFVK